MRLISLLTLTLTLFACGHDKSAEDTGAPQPADDTDTDTGGDTSPVDADGDGWVAGDDCDAADPPRGSPELDEAFGDAIDEDCDGQADDRSLSQADTIILGDPAHERTGGALAGGAQRRRCG